MKTHFFRSYRGTALACYLSSFCQAIIVNLIPLFFATFQREYAISFEKIGLMITVSFLIQIGVDLTATRLGERLRFRTGCIVAHLFSVCGLVCMSILPDRFSDPYTGIMTAQVLASVGAGLIEVLVSPIMEAIPERHTAGSLSLMHSFYCWGVVAVSLLSVVFFHFVGIGQWRLLLLAWSFVPALTAILFCVAPMPPQKSVEEEKAYPLRRLFSTRLLWILMILMVCAGACELSISQWASLFAEVGLGVPKAVGDILGPCAFALMMGCSRLYYGKHGETIDLRRALLLSSAGVLAGYLLIVLSPSPSISFAGVALTGLSVGLLWPGILSLSASSFPHGGNSLFALLAFCGDVGCSAGPGIVGAVSDVLNRDGSSAMNALKMGIAVSAVFSAVLLIGAVALLFDKKKQSFK